MPSSVPAVKKALRTYLRSLPGLTTADGVTVRGAPTEKLDAEQITLGDVTAPQARAGLQAKTETPSLVGWIQISRAEDNDDAEDAARDRAYELLALVETGIAKGGQPDSTAGLPSGITVGDSGLTEVPADLDGVAGRTAQLRFTVTWTSFTS